MIFEDPLRRRWRRALLVFAILALTALVTLGLVMAGLIVPPSLPHPFSRRSILSPAEFREAIERNVRPTYSKAQLQRQAKIRAQERKRMELLLQGSKTRALPLPNDSVVAFTFDDPLALASLEQHISQIDVAVPSWLDVPGSGCELVEHVDDLTRRVLSRSNIIVLPRLANLKAGTAQGLETSQLLANDKARNCMVQKIVGRLTTLGVGGINIDFQGLRPEDSESFTKFLIELRAPLHARSMRLAVSLPLRDSPMDVELIASVADALLLMAYDEHSPLSSPGPIASRPWFEGAMDDLLPRLPADRVVVILGSFGYKWNIDHPDQPATLVSFRNAMDQARATESNPILEPDIENGHFAYRDAEDETCDVWFQDALTTWNQVLYLKQRRVSRIGLWRLGLEDGTVWSFVGQDTPPDRPDVLTALPPGRSVEFYGDGEVVTVRSQSRAGSRDIEVVPGGHIIRGTYPNVPSGFLVERRGGNPGQVVLTFDDGPSEPWTPMLLDILKEQKVPAAFFVIGEDAMRFPDVVEREVEEGHLVGNHSFSHLQMETLTPREATVQISAAQRLIEGLTGTRTPIFRTPFTSYIDPNSSESFAPMRVALERGYVVVGANVDSEDWLMPGPENIVKRIVDNVVEGNGQIILFHDGGGDRSQSIEAVRLLIPALRQRGYEFVSLDKYLNLPRSSLETPLPFGERLISWGNALVAKVRAWGWTVLTVLFFVCTILAILRILFLGSLTIYELWSRNRSEPKDFTPLVSVLIPAFNEEKVIASTLEALQQSDYQNLEFVVVDDGSKDRTSEIVADLAAQDPRIRLFRQNNAGKAAAANRGIAEAKGEIIVAVDADTLVAQDSIPKLVRHFAREEVTAVCGNVEVGNVKSVLTAFQSIEYVTSQNFDRRAFSALNCISVVPGALGAWRRSAVLSAGGYSQDTLTEDADLTLTILSNGGKVVYESEAYGRTEAPETLGALLKQRFRWTYGTYQCLWKHRMRFFKGTLGWVGLPNMILFQIIFPTLSPIGDVVMLLSIFRGDWQAFLAGYLAFLAMDLCGSLLAFSLDRKPLRWLSLLIIQRFTYRQVMYYVSLKAMLAALRGARHGWRKLDRTGSVSAKDTRSKDSPARGS